MPCHRIVLLCCLAICAQAAVIDVTGLPTSGMVIISAEASPDLPWTYGTLVHVPAAPGDTLRIAPGSYGLLVFWGYRGSAAQAITVTNGDGRVICRNSVNWGALALYHCRHLRLTGSGSAEHRYGFLAGCSRSGMHTVQVLGDAGDLEIDHVEVDEAGFAGFNVKNEPTVGGAFNRGAYVMRNIHLHHNYVHDTGGEGFYLGHTFYNGVDRDGVTVYPHFVENLVVEHNHTLRTGAEGIQVGSCRSGLQVRFNRVEQAGIDPFANYQNNGIQIGMSPGAVIGNLVIEPAGNGLIILTPGDNQICGNVIIRPGANGMFVDERLSSAQSLADGGTPLGSSWIICNNTLVGCGRLSDDANQAGLRLYGDQVPVTIVRNNLIIGGPGPSWAVSPLSSAVNVSESHTVHSSDGSDLGLRDLAGDDYRPSATSSLVDAGSPVDDLGGAPWPDADGRLRPAGAGIDIGAYEWLASLRRIRIHGPDDDQAWTLDLQPTSQPGDGVFSDIDPQADARLRPLPSGSG